MILQPQHEAGEVPHLFIKEPLFSRRQRAEIAVSIEYREQIALHEDVRLVIGQRQLCPYVELIFDFNYVEAWLLHPSRC
jgi:hypothetical protein